MKIRGFTLIELIFVIVIIGVLAAVAVPKFKDLKAHAEIKNVAKILSDVANTAQASYINLVDLEGKNPYTEVKLKDIVSLSGKDWTYFVHTTDPRNNTRQYYSYKEESDIINNSPAFIDMRTSTRNANKTVYVRVAVQCRNFDDTTVRKKCEEFFGTEDKDPDGAGFPPHYSNTQNYHVIVPISEDGWHGW